MYFPLSINLLLLQCWSVYSQDQEIPASANHQVRRVTTGETPIGIPVSYTCQFINLWTGVRHPTDYPSGAAHWSPMLMASHNKKYTMFSQNPSKEASVGVQNVAEFGGTSNLKKELNAAGKVVNDITEASGSLFPTQNKPSKNIGQLEMDVTHRMISSISMIAPSPDWFTGLSNYRPTKDGKWLESFTVDTYPWDAGTDSGDTYSARNSATNPKETVYQILNDSPVNNVFVNDNSVLPVGRWSCTKVEETECKEDGNARFFRRMKDGKVKTQKCRWLGKKEARKRFCSKTSTHMFAPSAGDVCRVSCDTC